MIVSKDQSYFIFSFELKIIWYAQLKKMPQTSIRVKSHDIGGQFMYLPQEKMRLKNQRCQAASSRWWWLLGIFFISKSSIFFFRKRFKSSDCSILHNHIFFFVNEKVNARLSLFFENFETRKYLYRCLSLIYKWIKMYFFWVHLSNWESEETTLYNNCFSSMFPIYSLLKLICLKFRLYN